MKTYDAIIIGSGVSGLSAAYGLKEAGKTVLVVEEDLWGGTCPNRGCDPKKVLLSAVEARNRVKQLSGKDPNCQLGRTSKIQTNIYGSSPRKPKKTISRS